MNRFLIAFIFLISINLFAQSGKFVVRERFNAPEARQGIAVDKNFIYVVDTKQITKYNKSTHVLEKKWVTDKTKPIIHLDSGVIIGGKLYCAHSNYPEVPMTSSIEIWDAKTLKHIGSHSFGINWGSCTWVDKYEEYWYAAFAQYNKWKHLTGKGSEATVVVKFDKNWVFQESWIFPKEICEKFGKMSNSGGSFGSDGLLYCTGHDASELYIMKFPECGSILELVEILPIENSGQGIAWDRSNPNHIYCICKKERQVVVSELLTEDN